MTQIYESLLSRVTKTDRKNCFSGDFLIKYLYKNNKLKCVMSPYVKTCSVLLKKTAKEKIVFMDNLKKKLAYKKKKTPLRDKTA